MIIVSQDKIRILNFDNTFSLYIDKNETNKTIYAINNNADTQMMLGEYKTEERAKEVLQDIIKAHVTDRRAKDTDNFFGFSMMPKDIYYEMPED